ncbi:glycosyltransferase family 8 protein [Sclerotinia borealis F-4128]|uniref:Glycosyltransferase family 8 protein n=1 Tax=Sclerotinia borealis (strain F-4128) TaxID=1432307 RepID=W9CTA5_SCLBF|nr:glycosyltransferase family 8 protein [Sclerotinia borealis F-4128]
MDISCSSNGSSRGSYTWSPTTSDFPTTPTTPPNDYLPKAAYATLITSPSYLPGALLLAHTLRLHGSQFPLILLYTGLPAHYIPILEVEAKHSNIILQETTLLTISQSFGVAPRFAHTWTKLQVFSLYRDGWERICFLDADIMIMGSMDELLLNVVLSIPGVQGEKGKRLAANHVCVCNLENDNWAPSTWTHQNCAYTSSPSTALPLRNVLRTNRLPEENVQSVPASGTGPPTHTLLNSGLFVFEPSVETWNDMWRFISSNRAALDTYQFPDQDFLTEWWRDRWISVGWKWNALKTWRYWHPEMWRDEDVRGLHYIVDKPWTARVPASGIAGYKGNDGVTHSWWWDAFAKWEKERQEGGEDEVLKLVRGLVAEPLVAE